MFVPGDPCRSVLFHYRRREVENICATDENIIVAFEIDKIVLQPFIQHWRPLHDERVIAVRQTPNCLLYFTGRMSLMACGHSGNFLSETQVQPVVE